MREIKNMTAEIQKKKRLFGQTDLTKGNITKTILLFGLPIFLSYLLQTFYSIADAAICGYTLGANQVAGVGDTNAITFLFLQFTFGCTAGMSVIISNRIGKNDMDGARKAFASQIVLSVIIVAAVTTVGILTADPLLGLIGVKRSTSDTVGNEVYEAARTYIIIICAGMAGQFAYNAICCVLRSIGDSATPLVFLAISTVLNIALDLMFILVFRWGVAGAAAATVVSQLISAIGCFIFTFVKYKELRLCRSDFKAMNFKSSFEQLWQGIPLGLQFSVLAFGIIAMSNGVIAFDKTPAGVMTEGAPAQIGYGAACKLGNLLMTPLNALGTAMISFCGQNHGAGEYDRIKSGIKKSICMMFAIWIFDLIFGLLLTIDGAYQYLFLASDKITAQSVRFGNIYLYTVLPFYFLLGFIFNLRNIVQGLGKPIVPLFAGIAELAARILICLFLPAAINGAPISTQASSLSFCMLSLADVGAWLAADVLLVAATIVYTHRLGKITTLT